jgi:hypothetical protein
VVGTSIAVVLIFRFTFNSAGGYFGKKIGRFVGSKIGAGDLGSQVGDWVGDQVWGKAKGWLGLGLYEGQGSYGKGSANSLIEGSGRTPPMFGSVADETGALIVTHREYIGDIFGPDSTSRNFKNRVFDLNPGIERTFPWLSQIAQNYEEYEFGQLVFEFKSTVNPSVSGDGQMGTIVMVTNYNSGTRPFDDKNQMMQYDGSQSCRSTQHAVHGVECDPAKYSGASGHYIRTGPMPDEDIKSYDHGKFQLATVGMPSNFDNDPIGELWVYYTVKLRKPRLFTGKGLNISRDVYVLNQSASGSQVHQASAAWAAHASNSLGTQLSFVQELNLNTTTTSSDSGEWQITFPAAYSGNIELRLSCSGDFFSDFNGGTAGVVTGGASTMTTSMYELGFAKQITGQLTHGTTLELNASGNVTLIEDMFSVYPGDGVAESEILAPRGLNTVGTSSNSTDRNDMCVAIAHVKVGVATGGVDNVVKVIVPRVSVTSGAILQCSLEIQEYNTFNADPKGVAEGQYINAVTKVAVDPKTLIGF